MRVLYPRLAPIAAVVSRATDGKANTPDKLKFAKLFTEIKNSRNADISLISKDHKKLMNKLSNLKDDLLPLVNSPSETSEKREITNEELSEAIKSLIECADSFDIDGLDSLIEELSKVKLPLDFSQKFDKIRFYVQNVDFKALRIFLSEGSSKE